METVDIHREAENVPAWYVVYIRSHHEAKVQSYLQSQGIQAFVPWISVPSRRQDRFQLLRVPLFSGYLFVQTDMNPKDYNTIIRHKSVVHIVGGKDHSSSIPTEKIESLRTILEYGQTVYILDGRAPGRKVRLAAGPLAGVAGILCRRKGGKCRLAVEIEPLGKSVAVDVEVAEKEAENIS